MQSPRSPATSEYASSDRSSQPRVHLHSDPRVNPSLLRALSHVGLDRKREPKSLATIGTRLSTMDLAVLMAEIEMGFESLYEALPNDIMYDEVEMTTEREDRVIQGGDDQDMLLHIYRPAIRSQHLPCVVYFHGGGMTVLNTINKVHERWCQSLATAGLVVVLVAFRNAYTAAAYHPFPAGLNDCAKAVQYLHDNRDPLFIRNIVLQGEGGGGNLALATALKANREGWIHKINGLYTISPQISNAYRWSPSLKSQHLPSLLECNGYVMSVDVLGYMGLFYSPKEDDRTNPLAWPYHAKLEDLKGLPPHVMAMEELDPVRDEGIAYARKLANAGVEVIAKLNLGMVHASSVIYRRTLPHVHRSTVSDIVSFARRV